MPKPVESYGVYAEFGRRLAIALTNAGMDPSATNRATIGKALGVSAGMVSHMLSGKKLPKTENFLNMCETLMVDPMWLWTGSEVHTDALLAGLDENDKDTVVSLIMRLKKKEKA